MFGDDALTDAFIRHVRTNDDADFWAYEVMKTLAQADPVRALGIIERVLSEVTEPDRVDYIGAGPLEDTTFFIGQQLAQGNRAPFERLLESARHNAAIRTALASVWPEKEDPPELWAGIDAILGTKIYERWPQLAAAPPEST